MTHDDPIIVITLGPDPKARLATAQEVDDYHKSRNYYIPDYHGNPICINGETWRAMQRATTQEEADQILNEYRASKGIV